MRSESFVRSATGCHPTVLREGTATYGVPIRKLAAILSLALFAAVLAPLFSSPAEAQSKCTRVYTTSGWITRC